MQKVIFGTIRDEKLKKGELRVTVIASGFPEDQIMAASSASSIFNFAGNNADKKPSTTSASSQASNKESKSTKSDKRIEICKFFYL